MTEKKYTWWLISYQIYTDNGRLINSGDWIGGTSRDFFSAKDRNEFKSDRSKDYGGKCIIVSISNIGRATQKQMDRK